MEESILKAFYSIEPSLITVLISMLFTGDLSLIVEELYGTVQLSKEKKMEGEFENNLHFEILTRMNHFFEKPMEGRSDNEKRTYLAFLTAKVAENPRHKFLSDSMSWSLAKFLLKNH